MLNAQILSRERISEDHALPARDSAQHLIVRLVVGLALCPAFCRNIRAGSSQRVSSRHALRLVFLHPIEEIRHTLSVPSKPATWNRVLLGERVLVGHYVEYRELVGAFQACALSGNQ